MRLQKLLLVIFSSCFIFIANAAIKDLSPCDRECRCTPSRCGPAYSCVNRSPLDCCPGTNSLQYCFSAESRECSNYQAPSNCARYCESIHTCGR